MSSQISESNHNMVRAYCGSGSNQDLIAQLTCLFEKQAERFKTKEYEETKYKQQYIIKSKI